MVFVPRLPGKVRELCYFITMLTFLASAYFNPMSFHTRSDFDGWPTAESGELPIGYMTEENSQIIADRCSNQARPRMPELPTSL